MSRSLINRDIMIPPGFAERSCSLVKYRLPLLEHCYVLCHEPSASKEAQEPSVLMDFFIRQAERLAQESVGDPQAFLLIHNWPLIRKRSNWHVRVFVVRKPWEKTWIYVNLKNVALAIIHALSGSPTVHARLTSQSTREREFP